MQRTHADPGIFIRSMATRGHSAACRARPPTSRDCSTRRATTRVLIETVGVGQDEVEVSAPAHTTVVVLVPGMGDDVQAIKAGIMEIADIFVINKADREGADRACAELAMMLDLSGEKPWRPPIVATVATRNEGVAETLALYGTPPSSEFPARAPCGGGSVPGRGLPPFSRSASGAPSKRGLPSGTASRRRSEGFSSAGRTRTPPPCASSRSSSVRQWKPE